MNDVLKNLRGYRKFTIMVLIIVALSVLLATGQLTGPEFIDSLKFISTAFFAANFGGKLAGKDTNENSIQSRKTETSSTPTPDSGAVRCCGEPVPSEPKA